ncbi:chromosomal replication initiator protein DnaA [Candidatus Uhrbacteria bacterium]|nr:chromosomal replication initiator protein DnaA [Candidatus Uhrbacteria bacterium]
MTTLQLWQAALGELEILLSKPNFNTWLKETFVISHENERVIVGVPNAFTKTWLEKKYHPLIIKALRNVSQMPIREVIYKIESADIRQKISEHIFIKESAPALKQFAIPQTHQPVESQYTSTNGLNPRYTFSNFIVGKYCELAFAACSAIVSRPGEAYNPLFIYGGVGLGKTHLLQGVGHEILKQFPEKKVLFVTCEKFTNDYIHAIRSGRAKELKDIYRSVDVLIIDDIQFLSSKEGTQEEFFHTFNTLHQTNRQLVIASDRPPKAIPAIESRLLSRLEWGMTADISTPDLETRIAILEEKCKEKKYTLSPESINFIATMVHNNIRELEGALNRVIAYGQLNNMALSIEKIKQILSSLTVQYAKKSITPKQIINIVSEFYNIEVSDIIGECRKRELAVPRQIIMFLMREEIKCSFPMIGQELGGRDHTTAIHAHNKVSRDINEIPKIKQDIDLIRQRIYNI